MSSGQGGTRFTASPASNIGGTSSSPPARKLSQSSGQFSGLMNQKRNSQDATAQARRASFNEQKPAAGIIGNMWNKFTTGHSDK